MVAKRAPALTDIVSRADTQCVGQPALLVYGQTKVCAPEQSRVSDRHWFLCTPAS